MKLKFLGAAKTVTGSKTLVELWDNTRVLLDCGMYQGLGKDTYTLNSETPIDPKTLSAIVLSHAHIDHSGLIPKFVKDGFEGKIFATEATFALCEIMLQDSAFIQQADVRYSNKRKNRTGAAAYEPIYNNSDVEQALSQFEIIKENEKFKVAEGVEATFIPNGHILGSAAIYLEIDEIKEQSTILYTGDIGRYNTALIKDPECPPQADIVICESTYGDRLHDRTLDAEQELLSAVIHTIQEKKGKLIIPAFSLGRTQEIVFTLNKLDLYGLLPNVKIFVDSPLAVDATQITKYFSHLLNPEVKRFIASRPDPFGFNKLKYVKKKEDSQKINDSKEPCIIISASGMADAGRVKHHIYHAIENPKNTILFVGYAEPLSLGGKLQNGDQTVTIFGDEKKVLAEIKVISSMSAHGDFKEMMDYLKCQNPEKVSAMYLVHGEYKVQKAFHKKLKNLGFQKVFIPNLEETFVPTIH
ncbi:MAG: MBL fold metallo-hydrolase [Crocinitomicaceae bacterium]|jgi:metallo-beta-lactamase family protein|nr:MBL fold metallo-hydrolase [Crocinitomicaceae bacterium]